MKRIWIHGAYAGLLVALLIAALFGALDPLRDSSIDIDQKREKLVAYKHQMHTALLHQGGYRCCLHKPCLYCLDEATRHGEGATCDCMSDIMNGRQPCAECVGAILVGRGNRFIAEYFAKALSAGVDPPYKQALMVIIEQQYGIPVADQI